MRKDSKRDPYLVIEWSDSKTEAIGWLSIYNFADGVAGGGLRIMDTVTREEVERLSQVMSYKYVAGESKSGGAKGGIRYDYHKPDALDVMKRYLEAVKPYLMSGVVLGGDLGTDPADVRRIKRAMGVHDRVGNKLRCNPEKAKLADIKKDELSPATLDGMDMDHVSSGFSVAAGTDEAWKLLKGTTGASVAIQGFGKVGGSGALWLDRWGYKIVAISDINAMYYNADGLNVRDLLDSADELGEIHPDKLKSKVEIRNRDEWLGLEVDIIIPAAIEDVINKDTAPLVKASLISEGANIPTTPEADVILEAMGVHIVPDFVANQGGVTYWGIINDYYIDEETGDLTPMEIMNRLSGIVRKDVQKTLDYARAHNVSEREAA
ncbi:MAG: Glu/Leu/Phe/Val dehydrogenase dimerization domain-containing protein [Oscillospiraceae bacterium]|nr:Glu/Leu/Phe/Val dehydrogenase dimerization domain-containing protein [Oscillospiraceae bacterium]